jgi:hypothetical protein
LFFYDLYYNKKLRLFSRDFDDNELVESVGSITLQEVESRLIQLDPSIQDTMWYVWYIH